MSVLTMPTACMTPWQTAKRLRLIEMMTPKHLLAHLFDGRIDVESDSRIPEVAAKLRLSPAALMWRIARLLEAAA